MNDWKNQFQALYHRTMERVRDGERNPDRLFTDADRSFLASIGSKPIEMFDACDDFLSDGVPTPDETEQIHEVRRDYFLRAQHGNRPSQPAAIRARNSTLGGIEWLPRMIDKARGKLEGRLPDEFFYPCGGDRRLLNQLGIGRVEFFEIIRDNTTDGAVLAEVRKRMK